MSMYPREVHDWNATIAIRGNTKSGVTESTTTMVVRDAIPMAIGP